MPDSAEPAVTFEVPTDPPLPEVLPPETSISEVEPLHYLSCLHFYREDLERYVEQPLVEACRLLYDKNVPTTLTSANREDLEHGVDGVIFIYYEALSAENRRVAAEVGTIREVPKTSLRVVAISVPISAESTIATVSACAVGIVEEFHDQPPAGIRPPVGRDSSY